MSDIRDTAEQIVRKAAEQMVSGSNSDYYHKVLDISASVGSSWDHVTVTYPSATGETFTFKNGGSSGTTVAIFVVVYTDSTKEDLLTVDVTRS